MKISYRDVAAPELAIKQSRRSVKCSCHKPVKSIRMFHLLLAEASYPLAMCGVVISLGWQKMDMAETGTQENNSTGTELLRPRLAIQPLSPTFKMALTLGVTTGVQLHIRSGANVNSRDDTGRTPLIIAASKGHVEICAMLLKVGATPDLIDDSGRSALDLAITGKHTEVVMLFQRRADTAVASTNVTHLQNAYAYTAVACLATEPASGIDVDNSGDSIPFDLAVWVPEEETVPPRTDATVLRAVAALHRDLDNYLPVDIDEDWSDVEIDLPEFIARRRKRDTEKDAQWLRDASELILLGLRDGEIPRRLVEAITPESAEADDQGYSIDNATLLQIALGDIGVRILEDADAPWDPPSTGNEFDELFASSMAETMTFLRGLLSPGCDPLTHYLKALSKTKVLSRNEEGEIGRRMEDCRWQAFSAIARSGVAMEQVLATLNGIEDGERRWQDIFIDDEPHADSLQDDPDDDADNGLADGEGVVGPAVVGLPEGIARRMAELRAAHAVVEHASTAPEAGGAVDALAGQLMASGFQTRYVEHLKKTVDREEPDQKIRQELADAVNNLNGAKSRLYHHNQKLVFWQAQKARRRGLTLMDLVQEGSIGLLRAVDKFDYARGNKFATYAIWWIRQAMSRAASDQGRLIRVPVHMVEVVNKVRRTCEAFEKQYGRLPMAEELADLVATDQRRIAKALKLLDEPVSLDDENQDNSAAFHRLPSTIPDPEEALAAKELTAAIKYEMECLTSREYKVIALRFGLDTGVEHTLEEVGQVYDVTRERIRQIEAKALKKLRHPLRLRNLRGLL